jgi:hypothetical protein
MVRTLPILLLLLAGCASSREPLPDSRPFIPPPGRGGSAAGTTDPGDEDAPPVPSDLPGLLALALERFGRDPESWSMVLRRLLEGAHNVKANVSVDLVLVDLLLDIEQAWMTPTRSPSSPPRSGTAR